MKDSQRRTLVFSLLDDMKSADEKITAQTLATRAKMGKQTVLPYYREWQELEVLGKSEEAELSQELTRVLKREIAKEKFRLAEQLRELQDQLDEQQHDHTAQAEAWQQQLTEQQAQAEQQERQISELNRDNQSLRSTETELSNQLTSLTDKNHHLNNTVNKLEQTLIQEAKRAEEALAEQQRRLDESHSKIVDHWLKVLDEERQERARLRKQLEKSDTERSTLAKERARLEDQLEYEQRSHRQTVEQLKAIEQKVNTLEEQLLPLDAVIRQLGHSDNPQAAVAALQEQASTRLDKLRQTEAALAQSRQQGDSERERAEALARENRTRNEQIIRLETKLEMLQASKA